jgi:diguanylate cyclase (GGDEF)-like protein
MEHAQESFVELSGPQGARATLDDVRELFLANRLDEATAAGKALLDRADEFPLAVKVDLSLLLGTIASRQYRFDEALRHIFGALHGAEEDGDFLRQSRAHSEHARLLNRLGLNAEAASESYAALRLAGEDPRSRVHALGALSSAQQGLASPSTGLRTCEEMLALAQQLGDSELQAWAYRGLCGACLLEYQLAEGAASGSAGAGGLVHLHQAASHAAESVRLSVAAGCASSLRLGHYLQANVLIRLGDLPGARGKVNDMLAGLGEEMALYRALALRTRAHLEMLEHEHERSKSSAQEALSIFEALGDLREVSNSCGGLCETFEAAGDFKAALFWHRRFHESYKRFASESARAHAAAMAVKEEVDKARAAAEAASARADRLEHSNNVLVLEAEQLTRTAFEDGLTGIANRRKFDQELRALMADRRKRQRCSIALLDVDHFKRVNDRFSHVVGDEVLRRLAGLLKQNSRACDIVARFGGEEFAILFVELDADKALLACERVRHAVKDADWAVLHPQLQITVSLGFGHFDEGEDDGLEILKLVDQRLYDAKNSGRNRVVGPPEGAET